MWLSRLPDPRQISFSTEAPSFSEDILFHEKISDRYSCREYTSAFGLIAVLDGEGTFGINQHREDLTKEKYAVINFNSRLSIDITGGQSFPALLFFREHLPGVVAESLARTDEQLLDTPFTDPCQVDFALLERAHDMNDGLRTKLSLLTETGESSSSFAALKADSIVRSILEDIVIKNILARKESLHLAVKKKSTRTELYKRLHQAKEWINTHYHLPLTLDDLAAIACMNSQHFLRTFKQLFGITPHQYIIQTRLEAAKHLLSATGDPVQHICISTGWESLSSFSGLFKQKFGISPSQFRNHPDQ